MRILIAEDDVTSRTVLAAVLRQGGHEVVETVDGAAARDAPASKAEALRQALDQLKTLSGIIPTCANCKTIRDDRGYRNRVEVHVRDHTEARFSHGICPECREKLYPRPGQGDGRSVSS